jgi:DNA invertase Pin-like site-specific DNA recombinase
MWPRERAHAARRSTSCWPRSRPDDTVAVTRLDRFGRSLPHLLSLVENLAAQDVGLRSLAEQIDTSSATGRLVLHVFGALAEFERGINHALI